MILSTWARVKFNAQAAWGRRSVKYVSSPMDADASQKRRLGRRPDLLSLFVVVVAGRLLAVVLIEMPGPVAIAADAELVRVGVHPAGVS